MNHSKLSYRAEIDGLRAIAVVSVILYHAKMVFFGRDWFEGGFIGVDIFFVISGYLIARIILFELQSKGSFSFLRFYERRARRILPMLFVVIFVSMPYAWQKLLPSDFVEYAESILASLFFGSNFFFYFSTAEYGADSALLKPFLHTWSLGVEEQFYLIFPILAIAAFKLFRKHFITVLLGLSLLSLQFSELMHVRNSDLNFYLPFSRFWELAVGSILAYRELNNKASDESLWSKILPMLGLYLIVYSILFFDGKTPHPSFYTLIPIIGVALIIGFASKDELVGKALGSKPFVWVGLISFSAYLWHFPIFAFSRMGKNPSNYDKFEWIMLTFALSVLSYFLVEKPFRNNRIFRRKQFFLFMLIALTLSLSSSYLVISNNGYSERYPLIGYDFDYERIAQETWALVLNRDVNQYSSDDKTKVLLVGNSHSKDMFNAFQQNESFLKDFDFKRYGRSADIQILCFDETVDGFEKYRHSFYASNDYLRSDLIIISSSIITSDRSCKKRNQAEGASNDLKALPYLIDRMLSDKKHVILMGNHPFFGQHEGRSPISDLVVKGSINKQLDIKNVVETVNHEMFLEVDSKKADRIDSELLEIASSFNIPFFKKFPFICEENVCFGLSESGEKLFLDKAHWTLRGAEFFGEKMVSSSLHRCMLNLDDCR